MNPTKKRWKKWKNDALYFFLTPKAKIRRTCYHEAGHYMSAWLFPQLLQVNYVTIDRKNIDPQYRGGVHMTKITPGVERWHEAEKIMLVNVAGMAAATIYTHGLDYVQEKIPLFPHDETLIDAHGGKDDHLEAMGRAQAIRLRLGITPVWLYWQGFQFVCIALMECEIWEALTLVAEHLYISPKKVLTEAQISALFAQYLDLNTLAQKRLWILNERYPLDPQQLRVLY